jgi:DNA polymerase-1
MAGVGEQPGRMELLKGSVFVGPAGDELDVCLRSSKITRSSIYLTNTIKDLDRPLEYYIKAVYRTNKPVEVIVSPEGQQYIQELHQEIRSFKGRVIIAWGNAALYALTGRWGITNWRGSVLSPPELPNKIVVPTFHPATVIPPKNQFLNRRCIIFDMIRAKSVADGTFKRVKRVTRIRPTYHESLDLLKEIRDWGRKGNTVDYDIELSNQEVSCISFAKGRHFAFCIPFIDERGDYFTPEQEGVIWQEIARIIEDYRIPKRGQNLCFDAHLLLRKFGIAPRNLHDTMIAQRILMPDYNIGLNFITSIFTDMPYYKQDGKVWLKGIGTYEQGWEYNCKDSLACADAGPQQQWDLDTQGNKPTYQRTRRIILPLVYMMERGIKIDVRGMSKAYDDAEVTIAGYQQELNEMVGQELNANSFPQMDAYFYGKLGIKPYKKKGKKTLDETALIRIARRGFPQAKQALKIRGAVKERSTYLNPAKVDTDGRMRSSYNPVGTRFSRISSSENIFGTGNNLQNQPHKILQYFLADSGYIFYSLDLSQAENRIVAYVGRIQEMIDAFEAGRDVHRLTASLLFGKPYDEISDEPGSSPLGDGSKSERFYGKKSNHELNYDIGYRLFSLILQIPEVQGRGILEKYHRIYPGVRRDFQGYVKRCISTSRSLTNLLGRKTSFLDKMDTPESKDKLLKGAYSCIPQGSVGDIINERGLNYIYYNQDLFSPVELLTQVHDSIGFQIPLPEHFQQHSGPRPVPWLDHAKMLIKIKRSLEAPLTTHYGRTFSIPVDLTMGLNLYKEDGREIKSKCFSENPHLLAKKLEENFELLLPWEHYRYLWT